MDILIIETMLQKVMNLEIFGFVNYRLMSGVRWLGIFSALFVAFDCPSGENSLGEPTSKVNNISFSFEGKDVVIDFDKKILSIKGQSVSLPSERKGILEVDDQSYEYEIVGETTFDVKIILTLPASQTLPAAIVLKKIGLPAGAKGSIKTDVPVPLEEGSVSLLVNSRDNSLTTVYTVQIKAKEFPNTSIQSMAISYRETSYEVKFKGTYAEIELPPEASLDGSLYIDKLDVSEGAVFDKELNKPYSLKRGELVIRVMLEDKSQESTYKILFKVRPFTGTEIKNLTFLYDNAEYTADFFGTRAVISFPPGTDLLGSLIVSSIDLDEGASSSLKKGDTYSLNQFFLDINVTAQDGITSSMYQVRFDVEPYTKVGLEALTLVHRETDYSLDISKFNNNDNEIRVLLPKGVTRISTVSIKTLELDFNSTSDRMVGDNVSLTSQGAFEIRLSSEDRATMKTYRVVFEEDLFDGSRIEQFTILYKEIPSQVTLDHDNLTGSIEVGPDVDVIDGGVIILKMILSELAVADKEERGTYTLVNGQFSVTVTAQNGSKSEYTITVSRKPYGGAEIKSLILASNSLENPANFKGTRANILLPPEATIPTKVTVESFSLSDGASASIDGANLATDMEYTVARSIIDNEQIGTLTIRVVAEDQVSESVYDVVFKRLPFSMTSINSLQIAHGDMTYMLDSDFTFSNRRATVTLPKGQKATDALFSISSIVVDDGSTYTEEIETSSIKITVTAEDGKTSSSYEIQFKENLFEGNTITSISFRIENYSYRSGSEVDIQGQEIRVRVGWKTPLDNPILESITTSPGASLNDGIEAGMSFPITGFEGTINVRSQDNYIRSYTVKIIELQPQAKSYSGGTQSSNVRDNDLAVLGQAIHHNTIPDNEVVLIVENLAYGEKITWSFGSVEKEVDIGNDGRFSITKADITSEDGGPVQVQVETFSFQVAVYKKGEIWDWRDLQAISLDLAYTYELMRDIDLTSTYDLMRGTQISNDRAFEIIAKSSSSSSSSFDGSSFTGQLNGKNHEIVGLRLGSAGMNFVGLFGRLSNAVIRNLTLRDIHVTGGSYVGALAGDVRGMSRLENIVVQRGTVIGNQYTGGIAGSSTGGAFTNCHLKESMIEGTRLTDYPRYHGGILGKSNKGGSIDKCTVDNSCKLFTRVMLESNVNKAGYIGGIVGEVFDAGRAESSSIIDCSNQGDIDYIDYTRVGGIVGRIDRADISKSFSTGKISARLDVGGIAGFISDMVDVENCYSTSMITAGSYAGGITGGMEYNSSTLENCYYAGGSIQKSPRYDRNNPNFGNIIGVPSNERNAIGTIISCYYPLSNQTSIDIDLKDKVMVGINPIDISMWTSDPGNEVHEGPLFESWDFGSIWMFRSGQWPVFKPQ